MVSQRVQIGVMCGERWAENLLYRRYYKAAFSFAQKLVEREEDAEEIANDAMLKAFLNIEKFSPERGRFITWIYTIVRNAARNYKKSPKNNYGPPIEEINSDDVRRWEDDDRATQVPTCEIELPIHPRDLPGWNTLTILESACILALEYGEPAKETAARLGKSAVSIRVTRHRARAKLLEAMEKETARRPRSGTGLQAVMK